MIYLRLFWEFFKTGLFSVGGGLATLPFIYDMSDRTGWFTYQQIADMVAVSESTPGPIGVNTATYVGYITGGVPGALIATLGLVTPAVICILIIASCLKKFRENRFVDHAFYGLRPASAALIAAAGFSVVRISLIQESAFQASGRFTDLFFWKGLLLAAVLIALLYWYFGTEQGSAIRATGANPSMSRAQGININAMKVLGLSLSNGMVALSGGLMAQYQGFADINMGRGAIVIGLAAVIIGEVLCDAFFRKGCNFSVRLSFVILGGIVYYLVMVLILWLKLDPNDLKLFTAVIVAAFLAVPYLKGQAKSSFHRLKKGDK